MAGTALSWSKAIEEKKPDIRLAEITFGARKIQINPPEGEKKIVSSGSQMRAMASISISASLGSAATPTVDLAGGEEGK